MDFLDLRTVLVSYALCSLICAIILINLWFSNKSRFTGLDFYASSFAINFIGIVLLGLRNIIPDFVSIFLGNVLLLSGVFLLFIGISRFFTIRINSLFNIIILIGYAIIQLFLIYIYPSLPLRTIFFSMVLTIYSIQITWLLFSSKDKRFRTITRGLGVISIIYWMIGIIRIGFTIFGSSSDDLFKSNPIEISIYLLLQVVYILLTFYLFQMINRQLLYNLEDDIEIRNNIAAELQKSEEKFYRAFKSNPAPMILSEMESGKILNVNDAYLKLTGFEREEVLKSTTIELNMWDNPDDRYKLVEIIKKEGKLFNFQFNGRNKQGGLLHLVYSGERIILNNEECLISSLQDITERVINERIVALRLDLWEYSADHSTIELMTKALDVIESLTNSKISFFHLVNEKKSELVLQAWSTKTKADFCKAEGENMHYPLENAGVWADCVRERKPVIHNEFELVKNRKGMPDGHARIIRELVVPVIHKDVVEAVLGVGNKESLYTELDIEMVANVAGLVWFIVKQKQADDKILDLNRQLKDMAMTDELTQIPNRRSFFMKGNEEILRTRRYHEPLSVIMLDIDKFKKINDTYGHDTGDYVLHCIASLLTESVREIDIVGRLGGEEFAILLPNTKANDAAKMAERIRVAIENRSCTNSEIRKGITASFGVAQYHLALRNLDELLRDADIAMYEAKKNGRNRVEVFNMEIESE